MATLKIRKSENEVIELPLTTEKPIARSLAVFQDGKVYYCPLVHTNDSISSGVKIRIGDTNYALATQLYDPLTYDYSGAIWSHVGGGAVHSRGKFRTYDNTSYLIFPSTVYLEKSSHIEVSCKIRLGTTMGINQGIFILHIGSTRILLCINTSNKLRLMLNTTNIKISSTTFQAGEEHEVGFWYYDGVFDMLLDGSWLGEVSKSITAGNYTMRICSNENGVDPLVGEISNVNYQVGSVVGALRFGD